MASSAQSLKGGMGAASANSFCPPLASGIALHQGHQHRTDGKLASLHRHVRSRRSPLAGLLCPPLSRMQAMAAAPFQSTASQADWLASARAPDIDCTVTAKDVRSRQFAPPLLPIHRDIRARLQHHLKRAGFSQLTRRLAGETIVIEENGPAIGAAIGSMRRFGRDPCRRLRQDKSTPLRNLVPVSCLTMVGAHGTAGSHW